MLAVLSRARARLRRLMPLVVTLTVLLGGTTALSVAASKPAFAGTDTYPTSIAGCRDVATGATVTCNLKGSAQDSYFDPWGEYNRECTSYVAWMLHSVNGFTMPFHANASDWKADAQADGYTVNNTPAPGAVGWIAGGDHVVWVESVNSDGTVNTEGYNDPAGSGTYAEHLNQSASTYQYIHFKDLSGGGTH